MQKREYNMKTYKEKLFKGIEITARGKSLIDAIECGLIIADKNGDINIDAFSKFWDKVEERHPQLSKKHLDKEVFIARVPGYGLDLQIPLSIGAIILSIAALISIWLKPILIG